MASARVELPGFPALVVTGVIYPPEPDIGVWGEQVEELDWEGADHDLTPECDAELCTIADQIADAFLATLQQNRREVDAEIWLRNNGGW